MIRIFDSPSIDFSTNGIGPLTDCRSCIVTEVKNGEFELELTYPITKARYNDLIFRNIIVAKSNPYSKPQPFRIYHISKPINGIVTVNAQHISYDLSGCPVTPFHAESVTDAFAKLKAYMADGDKFNFWTDKDLTIPMTIGQPVSARAVLGGIEGSILDTYRGEFEFDEFTVKLHANRGSDKGVKIQYGKNLIDLTQEESCSNVYTSIFPYWYTEELGVVYLPEKIVHTDGVFDYERTLIVNFTEQFEFPPSEEELRSEARNYIKSHKIGVPDVSLDVSFVALADTLEYAERQVFEDIRLCDTVTVEFPKLNVSTKAQCVKTVYDALTDKYISISLGSTRANLAETLSVQEKAIATAPSKSYLEKAISTATSLITGQSGGYVVMNPPNNPTEILVLDTPDIKQARRVWRWNSGGLGYSSTGYEGPYNLAITMDGSINADFITSGIINGASIYADHIIVPGTDRPVFSVDSSGNISIDSPVVKVYGEAIATVKQLEAIELTPGPKGDTGNTGPAGPAGVGIRSSTITYGLSASETTQPSTWNAAVPSLVQGRYLWTKTVWTYTNDTTSTGYTKTYIPLDGTDGEDGIPGPKGVDGKTSYLHIAYATNATGTAGFSTTVSAGKTYIGQYTDFTQTDSTDPTKYKWTLIQGPTGVGVRSVTTTYGVSASETTQPSTWTASTPTLVKGQYLWTKTVLNMTDGTSPTGYSKTYIPRDGNNGNDGIPGKDGVGIRTTAVSYASSSSGTTAPTSGWTTTIPSVNPGQYLWTKTLWTYTDNTTETSYSVARMGSDGQQASVNITCGFTQGFSDRFIPIAKGVGSITPTSDGWAKFYYVNNTTSQQRVEFALPKPEGLTEGQLYTFLHEFRNNKSSATGISGLYSVMNENSSFFGNSTGKFEGRVTNAESRYSRTVNLYTDKNLTNTTFLVVFNINVEPGATLDVEGRISCYIGEYQGPYIPYMGGRDGVSSYTHLAYAEKSLTPFSDVRLNTFGYLGSSLVKTDNTITTTGGTNTLKVINAFDVTSGKQGWLFVHLKNIHPTDDMIVTFNGLGPSLNANFNTITVKPNQSLQYLVPAFARSTYDFFQVNVHTKDVSSYVTYEIYDLGFYQSPPFVNFARTPTISTTHIGMYVDSVSQDSNDISKYNWTLIKGADGKDGVPGPAGADGRTPYIHFAFSDKPDGTGLTMTDGGQRYQGYYTDYVQADSTDKTKYRWTDRWPKIEADGRNLLRKADQQIQNSNYLVGIYAMTDKPKVGDDMVMTLWGQLGENKLYWRLYNSGGSIGITNLSKLKEGVYQAKFKWVNSVTTSGGTVINEPAGLPYLHIYAFLSTVTAESRIDFVKLEYGTVGTGKTLAPEDIQSFIDSKADYELTQEQLNMLAEKAMVLEQEVAAKATQEQVTAWKQALDDFIAAEASQQEEAKQNLILATQRVVALETTLGQMAEKWTFMDRNIIFSNEGMTIGNPSGDSALLISDNRISMFSAGQEVMYVTQGVLHIDNGVFTKSLQIGWYIESQYATNEKINVRRYVGP